ncbi:putative sodium/solute symporter [Schistosoma mansoni]|uniref:putative sodium/solute symporter n=1 Tax=Schistosoma mansoni TaxID=6183 RepID=UPI0001A63994|nr:putative sodium/solute symporter [Schistosoma mansoni]|eukprot:XP_018652090.1 putative sodium/solute symporter [Schistosoma mansoni]
MLDSIETHNLEDLSPVEIDTVMTTKSRLPEFDRSDPELWFAQLEHYFTRHNIKSEGIRYRDLCSILPPSVAKEVRDLILDPPSPQPYTILRREIINRLSLSDGQRIQRLFQGETLGDRSPSQFLRHLQVLMGDNTVGEAVLKQGWIQALPCYVQHCLDAQDPETSLSHLARIADRIMERGPPTGPGAINHTQKVESAKDPVIEGLIASVKGLTEAVTRMQMGHRNRSRSPQRPRSKSQNRSQMSRQPAQFCWYHWKFGVNSAKCMQPCAWPKHNSKDSGKRKLTSCFPGINFKPKVRKKMNVEELFLGDRNLTLLPIVGSVMASFLSAVAILGTASEAYQCGIQFILLVGGYCIAFPLAAYVYMPVFYKLRLNSAHEYLEMRFGKLVRWTTSLVFLLQMVLYIALALYAPALAFSQVSGLPIWISILSTGLVATFYTAFGGIRAVVWVDLFQLIVLISGLCLITLLITLKVGGFQRLWGIVIDGQRVQSFDFSTDPFKRHTLWTLIIGGTGLVLSIFGANQTQIQRYLACRDLKTARRAILLNIPLTSGFLAVQLFTGLAIYAYFAGCDPVLNGSIKRYDQILPYIVMILFDGVVLVRGIFLSVIFAAALSTVSSGINSLANVCLEDLIRPLYIHWKHMDISERVKYRLALFLGILFGTLTVSLAFIFTLSSSHILQISFSLFGAIGGPILTVFTVGIFFPCINAEVRFNSRSKVNPRLLAWQARSFYRHFPNWLPSQTANDQELDQVSSTYIQETEISDMKLPRIQAVINRKLIPSVENDESKDSTIYQKNELM